MSALYELTIMLRNGTLPSVPQAFNKVVHVGHSFGSTLSVALAIMHPTASDGLILTGYSQNGSYLPTTVASWDSKLARLNQPLRFGNISYSAVSEALSTLMPSASNLTELANALSRFNITVGEVQEILQTTDIGDLFAGIEPSKLPKAADLPPGYLTWTDAGSNQFAFLLPEFFDPSILLSAEYSKFPYTLGELLTIGSGPYVAPNFRGPVQIVTGRKSFPPSFSTRTRQREKKLTSNVGQDAVYCGGDCLATGDPALASIPAKSKMAFPAASAFEAYIQPNTAHGINLHYNSTGAYNVIQRFLKAQGLASS